ncbi:helix-turn-helix transcriptional regulator [Paenibacillus sp. 1A_MP2]|uniref:helix-turn-helix transcriptional regulator n=1 Tax=Paenibacillus sp. 1A_MP2 TaxID=3457495 RepID=UPI003FCDD61B
MTKLLIFQQNLKKIRMVAEIEQQELANVLGVTRQTINNIENLKTTLTPTYYSTILSHLKTLALNGNTAIAPFIEYFLHIDQKQKGWRELSMHYKVNRLIREIHRIKDAGLTKKISEVIQDETKLTKKYYSYIINLWNQLVKTSSMIVSNIDELEDISRYYLKPLIEDFINFSNLYTYRENYVRAMQIHFLTEDIQASYRHHESFKEFGISNYSDPTDMERKRYKHYNRIDNMDILNAMRSNPKHPENYVFPISNRIYLYKLAAGEHNEEHVKHIEGLYDLANNHGHLNLRFLKKSRQNSALYTEILLELIEEILTDSTQIVLTEFGNWVLQKDFKSFSESLEEDEYSFLLGDDDEDFEEEEFDSDIYRITIHPDYETAKRTGASGFQVISVFGFDDDDIRINLIEKLDQNYIYQSAEQVLKDLKLDVKTQYEFE